MCEILSVVCLAGCEIYCHVMMFYQFHKLVQLQCCGTPKTLLQGYISLSTMIKTDEGNCAPSTVLMQMLRTYMVNLKSLSF